MNNNSSGIHKNTTDTHIEVTYQTRYALYDEANQCSKPVVQDKIICTETKVPKLGVMLVGLGGNNGSTFTAGVIANKKNITW